MYEFRSSWDARKDTVAVVVIILLSPITARREQETERSHTGERVERNVAAVTRIN
jgi:hypothetical protein